MFEVIWPARSGPVRHRRAGLEWEPGQIRTYDSHDDIPKEVLDDAGFQIREVEYGIDRVDIRTRPQVMEKPAGWKPKAKAEAKAKGKE